MDNVLIVAFVYWPAVVLVCAGLNMLVSWTFSWSELVFDYLIGVVAGLFLHYGTQAHPSAIVSFFLLFSHGLFGLLWWVSSGFRHLFHTPAAFLWFMGILRVSATLWAAALDRGSVALGAKLSPGPFFFSLLLIPAKWPFGLITSTPGFLIWLVGVVYAIADKGRAGFAGGIFFTEWNPGSGTESAVTLGWTSHAWNADHPLQHELYHTRQYIYMSDWLIPFWVLGILWGLASSAIGKESYSYAFNASKTKEIGNPLEVAAWHI